MAPGPQTRKLRKDQVERLERFRRSPQEGAPCGYSYPQLRLAMGSPCGWQTVKKALQGLPVSELIHSRLAEWIERYLPPPPRKAVKDGKAAAAGEKTEAVDAGASTTGGN